jgi:hypothetical protein
MLGWCMVLGMIDEDVKNVQTYVARLGTRSAAARAQSD